jgi:hypothetical protein
LPAFRISKDIGKLGILGKKLKFVQNFSNFQQMFYRSSMQSGQMIYEGKAGQYLGYDYEGLPQQVDGQIRTIDQQLQQQELIYQGRLCCSQFDQIQVYAYTTIDRRISISVMATNHKFVAIDCVSKFSDGSFLTTTSSRILSNAYEKQGLYRNSHPNLSVLELFAKHQANLKDFQMRCGASQKIFQDLGNLAQMVDEYTMRQKTNTGNFLWRWIGAFKILLRL